MHQAAKAPDAYLISYSDKDDKKTMERLRTGVNRCDELKDGYMTTGRTLCPQCGKPLFPADSFCQGCGAKIDGAVSGSVENTAPIDRVAFAAKPETDQKTVEKIAQYERISAILWMCLGVIQVAAGAIHGLMIAMIIIGVWNIHAAYSRLKLPALIRARSLSIPAMYEKQVLRLLIIGVLNLVLGGVIGAAFVVFDFVIRGMVLRHRALFTEEPVPLQAT
jgi:uncharacterized Zn finger protein (UPF0148 family)